MNTGDILRSKGFKVAKVTVSTEEIAKTILQLQELFNSNETIQSIQTRSKKQAKDSSHKRQD
jgi:hypothetical protein